VGVARNLVMLVGRVLVALAVTIGLNTVLKLLLQQSADNHIFKFLKNKISRDLTDFESQLYLCNEAFQWLDSHTYFRLASSSVLPLYLIYGGACLISYLAVLVNRWRTEPEIQSSRETKSRSNQTKPSVHVASNGGPPSEMSSSNGLPTMFDVSRRPDLCFHIGQSILLGALAISTLRMKCFWTPYLCTLAGAGVADPDLWNAFLNKVLSSAGMEKVGRWLRPVLLLALIFYLANKQKHVIDSSLEDLREFYDPDTVDLMQWIQQNTHQNAVMSGSMQLMAGIKLCTGRTLTNHPHFEDQHLRERTKELYQVYGKKSPQEVYDLLIKYSTNYIVLEDSICLNHRDRCTTPDIMDLVNMHVPEDGIVDPPHLLPSEYPRFCDEVRYDVAVYRRLFTKVFENKTFRIYRLNT